MNDVRFAGQRRAPLQLAVESLAQAAIERQGAGDPLAGDVVRLGLVLLWIAAGYQLFDGMQLASGFALRGAGDVRVPAVIFLALSWGIFVPLAHMLSFAPGQGWLDVLPQFGFGAVGGWFAMLAYVVLLSAALYLRWRSGRWRSIRL